MIEPHACSDAEFISSFEGSAAIPPLLRLIARGRPVDLAELAAVSGQPAPDLERILRAQPGPSGTTRVASLGSASAFDPPRTATWSAVTPSTPGAPPTRCSSRSFWEPTPSRNRPVRQPACRSASRSPEMR
jgi:hypothetical protein